MSYKERLKYLGLPWMLYCKLWGDMIEVFKYTTGKYDEAIDYLLHLSSNSRIGLENDLQNQTKISHQEKIKQMRRNTFSHSTVNLWNNLPQNVIDATSLNISKID